MKNVIIRILSLLVILCYSLSIIGFDVHTCKGSGRSFVVAFFEGMSCEDIHPEHECDHVSCCADHHDDHSSCACGHEESHGAGEVSVYESSCCSNDYHALQLTGTLSSDNGRQTEGGSVLHIQDIHADAGFQFSPVACRNISVQACVSGSGTFGHCDSQAVFSVWRI